MERYQLAKIISWAGIFHSRKRLQKIVYLLQTAGCPLDADYLLDHYGPYSQDVAYLIDEMVQIGLLAENPLDNEIGNDFSYHLTELALKDMPTFETTPRGKILLQQMEEFHSVALKLFPAGPIEMELAATMAYFYKKTLSWDQAGANTCKFQRLNMSDPLVQRAEMFAKHALSLDETLSLVGV